MLDYIVTSLLQPIFAYYMYITSNFIFWLNTYINHICNVTIIYVAKSTVVKLHKIYMKYITCDLHQIFNLNVTVLTRKLENRESKHFVQNKKIVDIKISKDLDNGNAKFLRSGTGLF